MAATDSTLILKTSVLTEPKIYCLEKSIDHDDPIQIQPLYIVKHKVGIPKYTFHFNAGIGTGNYLIPSLKRKSGNQKWTSSLDSELSSILNFPDDFPLDKIVGPLKTIITIDSKGKVINVTKENDVSSIIDDQIKTFLINSMWTIPHPSESDPSYRLRLSIYYQYLLR